MLNRHVNSWTKLDQYRSRTRYSLHTQSMVVTMKRPRSERKDLPKECSVAKVKTEEQKTMGPEDLSTRGVGVAQEGLALR